jgi:hypothetical protein
MSDEKSIKPVPRAFPATVVSVVEQGYTKVVINRGSVDGVKDGDRFLVYDIAEEELVDPEAGESLGRLETVRGVGVATHVQERMSTLEPEMRKKSPRRIVKSSPISMFGFGGREEVVEELEPRREEFNGPRKGDRAKPV